MYFMVELPGMAWAASTRTAPRTPFFLPLFLFTIARIATSYHDLHSFCQRAVYHLTLGVSNECKTRICVMSTTFAREQIINLSFPCCSKDCDPLPRPPFFQSVPGLSPPPLGVSNECKAIICVMPTMFAMKANHCFVFPIHYATNNKSPFLCLISHIP